MKKLDSKGRKSEPNGMAKGGLKMGDVVFTADWWGVRTFYRCLFLLFFFCRFHYLTFALSFNLYSSALLLLPNQKIN